MRVISANSKPSWDRNRLSFGSTWTRCIQSSWRSRGIASSQPMLSWHNLCNKPLIGGMKGCIIPKGSNNYSPETVPLYEWRVSHASWRELRTHPFRYSNKRLELSLSEDRWALDLSNQGQARREKVTRAPPWCNWWIWLVWNSLILKSSFTSVASLMAMSSVSTDLTQSST